MRHAPIAALVLLPGSARAVRVTLGIDRLADTQRHVGGWIEALPVTAAGTMYLDEEGKLKGLPVNDAANALLAVAGTRLQPGDLVVGPVVVVGAPDAEGEDTDVPDDLVALVTSLGLEVI